ncbi:MAG: hypothetical protein ACRDRG_07780 [Pseudonocardiaceae bacterium]
MTTEQTVPSTGTRTPSGRDRIAFHAGIAAIATLVLSLVGYAILSDGLPGVDASTEEWAAFYDDNHDQIVTGVTIFGVGTIFMLWYVAGVRYMLAAIEGGRGVASTIAFAGGLVMVGYYVVAQSGIEAAALRAGEVDPAVTQAVGDLHIVATGPTAAGFIAFYGAAAYVGYRYKVLHPVLVALLALAALGSFAAFGTANATSGALSAEGTIGLAEWLVIPGDIALIIALIRFRRSTTTTGAVADTSGSMS